MIWQLFMLTVGVGMILWMATHANRNKVYECECDHPKSDRIILSPDSAKEMDERPYCLYCGQQAVFKETLLGRWVRNAREFKDDCADAVDVMRGRKSPQDRYIDGDIDEEELEHAVEQQERERVKE